MDLPQFNIFAVHVQCVLIKKTSNGQTYRQLYTLWLPLDNSHKLIAYSACGTCVDWHILSLTLQVNYKVKLDKINCIQITHLTRDEQIANNTLEE
jgi:hypothetical protein